MQRMSLERHRQQMLGRQKQELKGALPNEQQRRRCVDKPWGSLPTSLFPMWSRALAPKVCSETQLHALFSCSNGNPSRFGWLPGAGINVDSLDLEIDVQFAVCP